jgi:phosphomevalonate kinase
MPGDPAKTKTTTVSAPGKILLAGGYVVLESGNVGVVLAVDKRFYSTVTLKEGGDAEPDAKKAKVESESKIVTVNSPQFGATWKFQVKTRMDSTQELVADPSNKTKNIFVEKTLRITLAYLCPEKKLESLDITILADNDFYSVMPHLQAREWDATPKNLERLPRFLPCQLSSGSLQKTGLGSSAALVTSLVGAIVLAMSYATEMDETTRKRVHNLAQICHCHAQGKVGSGFDVSSASYGSHVYQRFPKILLSGLLQKLDGVEGATLPKDVVETLRNLVEEPSEEFKWAGGVQKALSWNTDLLQIMLADVSGGSESPSMARKILNWKVSSEDISCWTNLLKLNQQVVDISDQIVEALKGSGRSVIKDMTNTFSGRKFDGSWESTNGDDDATNTVGKLLCEMRATLLETRKNLKQMGELAEVPVEPDEQSKLADATMDLPGVVASLVPGAGGYDALVVVYVNTPDVRDKVCELWRSYKELTVCPLAVQYEGYGYGVQYEAENPKYQATEISG